MHEHSLPKAPEFLDDHHLGLIGVSTAGDFIFQVLHDLAKLKVQSRVGAQPLQEFEIVG